MLQLPLLVQLPAFPPCLALTGAHTLCAGADLRAALDDVLAAQPVGRPIKKSIGCNIKWAPGNEPSWFG